MITFWNRKEVYSGYSIKDYNKTKETLKSNEIIYITKVVNRKSSNLFGPSRSHTGSFGEKTEFNYEYYIFVHKDDYEKAMMFINKY